MSFNFPELNLPFSCCCIQSTSLKRIEFENRVKEFKFWVEIIRHVFCDLILTLRKWTKFRNGTDKISAYFISLKKSEHSDF